MHSRVSDNTRSPQPVEDPRLAELDRLATLLDSRWGLKGTPFTFGIDGVASLLPVIGDGATGLISAYIIYRAAKMGAPQNVLVKMAGNAGLDFVIGSIPVAGTVFDVFFKANKRNIRLLRAHLERQHPRNT
ncbi:DUF4112 domain-containing protein [Nitratireductor basaltis]|uniref:DUF4112 domain-containing protein n=1 Tax=Nitratireductor basaltis TaxID=472175 RepID=A0A084U6N7_9HYPH|nr:DUF4112 domain-containing protein [Nitratireductor basaltis]KFB08623.1 hypothetical protein EL18_02876 [Nitratireductor basaltis]